MIYPNQTFTDTLPAGSLLTLTVVGSGLLSFTSPSGIVTKSGLTANASFGPFQTDQFYKITCITGTIDFSETVADGANPLITAATDPLTGAVTGLVGPGGVLVGVPLVILQAAAPITLTGTTALTTLAKKTIPAGTLRVGDALVVRWLASNNNNANNKTVSLRLGSQEYFGSAVTTATTSQHEIALFVRGETSQVGGNQYGGPAFGNAYAGSVPVALDRDIAADQALTIRGQLAVSTDTLTLEAFSMTLLRGVGVNEA